MALSPRWFSASSNRLTCRTLTPTSCAASRCVMSFFVTFLSATSRSRSACVMSSCPSRIPPAWDCQEDISTLPKEDIITLLPQRPPESPSRNFPELLEARAFLLRNARRHTEFRPVPGPLHDEGLCGY